MLKLANYRVAIAGGSKGIGRACAEAFAAAGAQVSVCARHQDHLAAMQKDFHQQGLDVNVNVCDLGNAQAIQPWLEKVVNELGGLDALIVNASGYGMGDTDADWQAAFDIDLMASVRATRIAQSYLAKSTCPSITYLSSIAAFHPGATNPAYAGIKAAISHYVTSKAKQLAPQHIRVNAIAPGSIEFAGGIWDRCKHQDPDTYTKVLGKIPFGRYGEPKDIADVALFLASPMARWITGQTLCVDGGQLLNG